MGAKIVVLCGTWLMQVVATKWKYRWIYEDGETWLDETKEDLQDYTTNFIHEITSSGRKYCISGQIW